MLAHKKFPTVGASLLAIAAATLGWATEAEARVASIVIDSPAAPRHSPARQSAPPGPMSR